MNELHLELMRDFGRFTRDPFGFVMYAFPWSVKGTALENEYPEDWQIKVLKEIGDEISFEKVVRYAISSGHGIGKSAFFCWIIIWGLATFPNTRIRVTAETGTQLSTVVWAELAKWHQLFIGRDLFRWSPTSYVWAASPQNWRADAVTWSDKNSSGFAGLHNSGRRTIVLMDEVSAIPSEIHDAAEGALSDDNTERLMLVAGNPTEPNGRFHDIFYKLKHIWRTKFVDSRTVRRTDKKKINELIDTWGIDSNVVKVRVLGQFPTESANQLIPFGSVMAAMNRPPVNDNGAPIIIGVDPSSGHGECESVVVVRDGKYIRKDMVYRFKQHDTMLEFSQQVARIIDKWKPDQIFIDGCAYGNTVEQQLHAMGYMNAQAINAGGSSSDKRFKNKRAQNWCAFKEDLEGGVFSLPDDPDILAQATSVPYKLDSVSGAILLEPKEKLAVSPDIVDAIVVTYSLPVPRRDMRDRFQTWQQPQSYIDEVLYG